MKRTSALLTLMMPAAPKPWNTRAIARDGSDQDIAQARDAIVNMMNPPW